MADKQQGLEELKRGIVEVLPQYGLEALLAENRVLRVKAGFDPTASNLHLGHTLLFEKLKRFQDLGHTILLVVGDFTATIGDPTGKNKTRPPLKREDVLSHAKTYTDQALKMLDPDKTEVLFNADWLSALAPKDFIHLAASQTVARMLEREDFSQRYRSNQPISIHEFLYPLMQGYDSVALKADIELGGTDQRFNLLMGRDMQKYYQQNPQTIMMLPLLEGIDGFQKMSKSHGNTIDITDSPDAMFGKIMSLSDTRMWHYIQLLSHASSAQQAQWKKEIEQGSNPRDRKQHFAQEIVTRFHHAEAAKQAQETFIARFQQHALPTDVPLQHLQTDNPRLRLTQLLKQARLAPSTSHAMRLIRQGGVKIDGKSVSDTQQTVKIGTPHLYQVGKRHFASIQVELL